MSQIHTSVSDIRPVIIVGSGPAGFTAAIYAARAGLRPLVIAGLDYGGQLTTTTEVDNFPGFPDGIEGPELMKRIQRQAERFGTEIVYEKAVDLDTSCHPYRVTTDSGAIHEAKAVILATGATAKWLGHPAEQAFRHKGVSACATCDGFFYKGKPVVVIGGGDTAFEEALYLSTLASEVTLVHRRLDFRASKIMVDKARATPNLTILTPYQLEDIQAGDNQRMQEAIFKHLETGEDVRIPARGMFVAIGHKPNSELFPDGADVNGYLQRRTDGTTATWIPGVFVAGDVADSRYRQAITAAGSGCQAALDAQRWLESYAENIQA